MLGSIAWEYIPKSLINAGQNLNFSERVGSNDTLYTTGDKT
jgi:hypothetical protein